LFFVWTGVKWMFEKLPPFDGGDFEIARTV